MLIYTSNDSSIFFIISLDIQMDENYIKALYRYR